MNKLISFFRQLFCKHKEFTIIRYINFDGLRESQYCLKCQNRKEILLAKNSDLWKEHDHE